MDKTYTPYRIKPINYQCRTADPSGMRFSITHMRWASCPYHNVHAKLQGRLLGSLLFDKWNKRPNSAYKLYWRTHSAEEAAVEAYYANQRAKKRITK